MIFSYSDRILQEGRFLVERNATIRQTAKAFNISKSCVHKDLTQKLPQIDAPLYFLVKQILTQNFNQKHIRGGIATQNNFKTKKSKTV